eukprot:g8930.t1
MSRTSETADRVERPPSPTLCSMNCGFFSNPECKGMCSICYRNFLSKEKEAKTADESSDLVSQTNSNIPLDANSVQKEPKIVDERAEVVVAAAAKRPRRICCPVCKKKVGLLAFQCRCGGHFCEAHRYPEAHQCTFDHKAAARSKLQDENPVVLSDKIDRV